MIALALAALTAAAERADRLRLSGAVTAALDATSAELNESRALMDRRREAWALDVMGRVLEDQGRAAEGRQRQEDARAIARGLADRSLEARIVADMGFGHWKRAEYEEARRLCDEALAIQIEIGDDEGRAVTLSYLGRVAFKLGDGSGARELFSQALAIESAARDRRGQAISHEDLGYLQLDARRYADAVEEFALGLSLANALRDDGLACQMLVNAGIVHLFQGDTPRAEAAFRSALARAEAGGDTGWGASARSHLVRALARQQRLDEALRQADACVTLREALGDPRAMAWDLASRASIERDLGLRTRALESYLRALDIWRELVDRRAMAWHLLEVARLYAELGDTSQAFAAFTRCLDLSAQIGLPYASIAMGEVGILHARAGDPAGALAWGQRAIEEAERVGNAEAEAQAFHHRARILEMLGRPADAVEDIARAVDLIEMLRGLSVPEPSARVAVFEDRQGVYADGVRLLFGLGRLEEALVMAERAKGRAILDILESRASGSPALLAAPAATFATMKTAAREGRSTFVSYVFAGPLLLVFAIDQQGAVHAAESPIAPEEVRRLVEAARASIAAGDAAADPLERLHAALIAPVEPWLPRDPEDVVTIVPHGPLFYLSFAALRDARARPLVESHALCYEPAIGLATLTRREQRADQRTVLAIGNPLMPAIPGRDLPPLPAAEDEARDVAARFPRSQDSLLLGNRASERQVRRLATGRACLHFATHAVLRDDEPLESLVILSATTGESDATADGLLTAEEILDLHLDADLVTLSACETGLGRVTGDGIIGLARSFLGAGAASVVASLWSVADVSTRFQMERFYSELGQGVPKARALRHAQVATIDALRQGAIRTPSGRVLPESPFFWAPFVLIGDPGR